MKKIYLVRHAKAEPQNFSVSDFNRELIDVGILRSKKVFSKLNTLVPHIDFVISSSASRCMMTTNIFSNIFKHPEEKILYTKAMYNADVSDLLVFLKDLDADIESVMLVGHNPTISSFANLLTGGNVSLMKTSDLIAINAEINEWDAIAESNTYFNYDIIAKEI